MKFDEIAVVDSQRMLQDGIYDMWITTTDVAANAVPGQFISVYTKDASKILPRPISICEVSDNKLRIVYRVAGEGTAQFSQYEAGDEIHILGPLGNGFPIDNMEGKKAILIGGGIGIPPMLELAKQLPCEKEIVLGYRSNDTFLDDELQKLGNVTIASDDGSI